MGEGVAPGDFRFNDIELVTDKREYAPGDKVNLLVNTARPDSWIVLFLRPANGMYLMPKIVHAEGQEHAGGDRGRQEGHAELLRRGVHRRRRAASTPRRAK